MGDVWTCRQPRNAQHGPAGPLYSAHAGEAVKYSRLSLCGARAFKKLSPYTRGLGVVEEIELESIVSPADSPYLPHFDSDGLSLSLSLSLTTTADAIVKSEQAIAIIRCQEEKGPRRTGCHNTVFLSCANIARCSMLSSGAAGGFSGDGYVQPSYLGSEPSETASHHFFEWSPLTWKRAECDQ